MPEEKDPKPGQEKKPEEMSTAELLEEGVSEETAKREEQISNVSAQIAKMQKEITEKTLEVEDKASDIKEVKSGVSQVLGRMSDTIGSLATGVNRVSMATATGTKQAIAQYGRAVSEDISFNKSNIIAMSLARSTPIFGYFAGKFMETEIFKGAAERIKNKLGDAMSAVGERFKGAMAAGLGRIKGVFGKKASEEERKITSAMGTSPAQTVEVAEEAKGEAEEKGAAAGIGEVPKMQAGGYVEKGGLVHLHPAEVVMPIEKAMGKFDSSMEKREKFELEKEKQEEVMRKQTISEIITSVLAGRKMEAEIREEVEEGEKKGFVRDFIECSTGPILV